MTFWESFIKRPVYSVLFMLILIAGGIWGLMHMPVDYFPGLKYPLVNVITQYPGVSPQDMEILVTRPIENRLQGLRGVHRTSSISAMGISQVTVEFSQGYNMLQARQLVSAALSQLAGQLPEGINPLIDNLGSRMQQIIGFTFENSQISQTELRRIIQYRLKPALHSVAGISRIDVFGGLRPAYIVEPDADALRRLHLSMNDIARILKENNVVYSGRYLTKGYMDIPIRADGRVYTLNDLRRLYVGKTANGLPIFLNDIAHIRKGGLPEHYIVRSGKQPAVVLVVQKADGYGTINVAHAVENKVHRLQSLLPPHTIIHKYYDQSEILDESMNGVKNEMLFGVLLAMLALFLFIRRLTPMLIVSLTIPLALFAAVMLMYFSSFTLNMMTLAALTLSIGMVVDDSIIIMENIERFIEQGFPLWQSVLQGTKQILAADVSGTLTTVSVFIPLLFVTGFLGDLILPFGLTISYTLLASLLISLTIIPALMHWKGKMKSGVPKQPEFLKRFIAWNDRWFRRVMHHKKRTFVTLALLFFVSASLLPLFNKTTLMPVIDEGALLIEYVMRPGVSLDESYQLAEQLISEIQKIPDVDNIYLKIGSPENTYYIESVNRGELRIKLKPNKQRRQNITEIMNHLKNRFSGLDGVVLLYHQPTQEKIDESFSGLPAFFGISVSGDNIDTLRSLSVRVEQAMRQNGNLSNIVNDARFTVPQIEVRPKRAQLALYGLSADQLMRQLSLAFRGRVVTRFVKDQTPVSVFLRLPKGERQNIEQLKNLPVRTESGKYIPLQQLASLTMREIMPALTHLNGQREVTLIAEPAGNLWATVARLQEQFKSLAFPSGYTYQIRGQYQTLVESIKSFGLVILAAVLFVYLLLYLQFNSFWQPFVILLKAPLDFIGAFIAILLTRQSINISVGIGLLTLVGVSVNNAIILLDMANQLRKEKGLPIDEALLQAVHLRTRPILMTGLTTILGLLPAAIGFGIGSKIHQPFAITLIGGMITGILFSLNIIPAIYAAFAGKFKLKN